MAAVAERAVRAVAHAPLNHFPVQNGELVIGGMPLTRLAARVGRTPFYAYDRGLLAARVASLRAAESPVGKGVADGAIRIGLGSVPTRQNLVEHRDRLGATISRHQYRTEHACRSQRTRRAVAKLAS